MKILALTDPFLALLLRAYDRCRTQTVPLHRSEGPAVHCRFISIYEKPSIWSRYSKVPAASSVCRASRIVWPVRRRGKRQTAFGLTGTGRRVITGSVSATVEVVCQRCLEPLSLKLADTIQLALVESESQIDSLEAAWDPWMVDGPRISIASLLEEQLMLCMPLVSYHPDERCVKALEYQQRKEPRMTAAETGQLRTLLKCLKYLRKMTKHPDVARILVILKLENKHGCTTE